MTHSGFLFLHLLGVVLLLGNVTVTSAWKVFADRTGDFGVIAFAQKLVIYADWAFTVWGAALIIIGGYGMLWRSNISPWSSPWLIWSQVWFVVSGVIWLAVLVPLQGAQLRTAKDAQRNRDAVHAYRRLSRYWLVWGLIATVPLVAAMWLMVHK